MHASQVVEGPGIPFGQEPGLIESPGPGVHGDDPAHEQRVIAEGVALHQPAFQVDAIGTTGAGDAFHGAFVTGLKKNWDIRSIVQFASAVAAISCKHVGGKSGLPTIEETINFLEKNRVDNEVFKKENKHAE